MTLDQQIQLWNAVGTWLAGIATFAAVVVSLYLANRLASPKAKLSVGHRIIVEPGVKKPAPEYVLFQIVNTGERPIRVTGIGWKVGFWKKRHAIQMSENLLSSPLPVELSHGQEAKWFVPLAARDEPWLAYFAKGMLFPNCGFSCYSLRAQAFISTGRVFEAKPEINLLSKLRAECKKVTTK
jgi:hypothetical protein